MSKSKICDALKKVASSQEPAWITIDDCRVKIGPINIEQVESGDRVIIATKKGYSPVEVYHRKGPHTGLARWQVQPGYFWIDADRIRAKILESHKLKDKP